MKVKCCDEKRFLRDVATHKMTVLRDDGVHRHIQFKQPDSGNMRFDLITWPGFLCYCGDMGTYVFQRLPDMFNFFRNSSADCKGLYINLGYWAEKCEAHDRSGVEEYSAEKFRDVIKDILKEEKATKGLRQAVQDEVLDYADDGFDTAYRCADDFEHNGFKFTDLFEYDFKDYTFRFIWCCYAMAWGIQTYDKAKAESV